MFRLAVALAAALAALGAEAAAANLDAALEMPAVPSATLNGEAAFLAKLLQQGGAVYYHLPEDALPSHDEKGRWRSEPLQAALRAQGALAFRGDGAKASAGLAETPALGGPVDEGDGRWLYAAGLPRVLVLENSSTVSPLSKGLKAWGWPHTVKGFAEVEAAPSSLLKASAYDAVVFSSPGWWDDFADPPGGPSRMGAKVSVALRDFVRQGGTAIFIDISQWDLEKAWPKSLNLTPLGPYALSKMRLEDGPKGNLSLAPVGVGADKLRAKGAFSLVGADSFSFPDGGQRPVHAAYAMPDPGGGQGWVAGLAFHVFEQDDSLALAARRLLLNLLLLSGNRRLATQGEAKAPTPPPATATLTPQRTATVTPLPPTSTETFTPTPNWTATSVPSEAPAQEPTEAPTLVPTKAPTSTPTELPTKVPTLASTAVPTKAPTALPTRAPTKAPIVPTPVPTAVATLAPTKAPTALPTKAPTPVPTAVPTKVPTRVPTLVPTLAPTRPPAPTLRPTQAPTLKPTQVPPTLVPTRPVPTLRPTPLPPTPRPTAVPTRRPTPRPLPRLSVGPTLLPTRPWPTLIPTRPVPTLVPTLPVPTLVPTRPLLIPTAVPTPRPKKVLLRPSPTAAPPPTPRPTAMLTESVRNALGCLASAPEPFMDGGVYIQFCLGHAARVKVSVYDRQGKELWHSAEQSLVAGQQQVYFDGRVNGARLTPGPYLFDISATYATGQRESRQGTLTRGKKGRR